MTFLKQLVRHSRRKLFLILDNGSCHNLDDEGKVWLGANQHRVELFRLPSYSPNFNPTEGAWKETKKRTTHNRFFHTTDERDATLVATFRAFKSNPKAGHDFYCHEASVVITWPNETRYSASQPEEAAPQPRDGSPSVEQQSDRSRRGCERPL